MRLAVPLGAVNAMIRINGIRSPMPIAIYTAVYGGYDVLKDPVQQDVDCDFLCFTDRPIETATRWRVVVRPVPALHHPRMQAKWFKLMNHKIFPNGRLGLRYGRRLQERRRYDATIWVDASLSIRGGAFAREVSCLTRDGAVAVYAHPDRDCIYDETDVSLTMPKYRNLPLREQVEAYRRDGHPSHAGLYACGIIGRKAPGSPLQQSFDTAWWHENEHLSYHDQLSFAFLARRMGLPIERIPGHLWRNEHFDWVAHTSEL
jgi:hypothetical protein